MYREGSFGSGMVDSTLLAWQGGVDVGQGRGKVGWTMAYAERLGVARRGETGGETWGSWMEHAAKEMAANRRGVSRLDRKRVGMVA